MKPLSFITYKSFFLISILFLLASCDNNSQRKPSDSSSIPILGDKATNTIELNVTPTKNLTGGASASFVCKQNVTYGNPLEGMGEITNISAPTTGPFPYFEFLEGPVWVDSFEGGSLFFSDLVAPARIWKLTPPSTLPTLFFENSGSNGLAIDANDNLILADRIAKRITRLDPNTGLITNEVVPANGVYRPNDLIVRSDNNIYFTAPKNGFYRVTPNGTLTEPQKSLPNPNGITLSLDESTLYVGDSKNNNVTTFKLRLDGSIDATSASLFTTTQGSKVDGMAIDCAGNLYVATTSGVEVFNTSGSPLGVIPTGRASNVTFGGAHRKTLYVTAVDLLKSVELQIPGLPN